MVCRTGVGLAGGEGHPATRARLDGACIMTETLRTIRLYGKLSKFGREHRLAVANPAEAIRALCVLIPGFEKELMTSKDRGIGYAVFIGKQNLKEDELQVPPGQEDIRIAPVIMGSKNGGIFNIILGVVLIASSFLIPSNGLLGLGVLTQGTVAGLGLSLALGGIIQVISPQPSGLSGVQSPDNGASYNFNGPVNVTAQGNPVPLLYGEMIVGSATISAGIYSQRQQ